MLNRLFVLNNACFKMLGLKLLPSLSKMTFMVILVTMAMAMAMANTTHAYTLQGPRYSSAPAPQDNGKGQDETKQAQNNQKKNKPQKELSLEEQAIIKEQNEFMSQIQNSIVPNVELENKEIEQIVAAGDTPLLVYGSSKLDKFIGCLNCHPKFSISVWNANGPYGSSRGDFSMWNSLFEFGNVKSRVCPWNMFASNPPAVIDPKGNFYGFLTSNTTVNSHFKNNFTLTLLMDYKYIGLSPQKWFEDTFASQLASNPNTVELKDLMALPKPIPKDQRLLPTKNQSISQTPERRPFNPFGEPQADPYQHQVQDHNQPFKFP